MNIKAFPVGTTNLFPAANTVTGGQLLTEFNIRSRESVATPSQVKYIIGPSYTHSMEDFSISAQQDTLGNTISTTILQISPGRAVVNGHYVESLAPVTVDMSELNYQINTHNKDESATYIEPLTGELCVGIRMMYSTDKTIAGSVLVENENDYFEGVQLVILKSADFILPVDSPNDESKVTAHLLLGKFNFINGNMSGVVQNEDKIKTVDGDRIGSLEGMLSEGYISNFGLNPDKIYAYAGAGAIDKAGNVTSKSTWQDATGSLIRWKKELERDTRNTSLEEAAFVYDDINDETKLVLPLLQNARKWEIKNTAGDRVYYKDAELTLPNADYAKSTGGMVTKTFINKMKDISEKMDNFYHLSGGRLKQYIPELHYKEGTMIRDLPKIDKPTFTYSPVSIDTINAKINNVEGLVLRLNRELTRITNNFDAMVSGTATVADLRNTDTELEANMNTINELVEKIEQAIQDLQDWREEQEGGGDSSDVKKYITKELPKNDNASGAGDDDYPKASDLTGAGEKQLMKASKKMRDVAQQIVDVLQGKGSSSGGDDEEDTNKNGLIGLANSLNVSVKALKNQIGTLPKDISSLQSDVTELKNWKESSYSDDVASVVDSRLTELRQDLIASLTDWKNSSYASIQAFFEDKIIREYHLDNLDSTLPGDYVLVGQDFTVGEFTETEEENPQGRNPSTMYVVQPGICNWLTYIGKADELCHPTSESDITEYMKHGPKYYRGVMLASMEVEEFDDSGLPIGKTLDADDRLIAGLDITNYRGSTNIDYFVITKINYTWPEIEGESTPTDSNGELLPYSIQNFFFTPVSDQEYTWSEPIYLTREINYATNEQVGGFLNAENDWFGGGYVIRDDNGYLRVLDYDLLATGVLAYQLGEDIQCAAGSSYEEVQTWLNDYVNYRVAFPNVNHLQNINRLVSEGKLPSNAVADAQTIINVTVDISEWGNNTEDSPNNILTIGNIDSRFCTTVYLHLTGTASQGTIIDIADIEHLMLDISSLSGSPTINLFNCELYYDPLVLNRLNQIEGLKLWYQKFSHIDEAAPNLIVNGNTVQVLSKPVMSSMEDFWGETTPADNAYFVALKSLTFSDKGQITDVGILIRDSSTVNDAITSDDDQMYGGDSIYASTFVIPQGQSFPYPQKMLTEPIRISGSFVHAYPGGDAGGYFVSDNRFTILTQAYNAQNDSQSHGTISILSSHKHVTRVTGNVFYTDEHGDINYEKIEGKNIDGWDSYGWHSFTGGLAFR